jgi:CheY-like chemotaxis protein/two-component sensor histidine kinase
MSHELRTPLNSIVALTELLAAGSDPLTSEQRTQVEFIRRMATDQLQLVGELLDLAKIEAGRAEISLSAVSVTELFALLRTQLRPLTAGSKVSLVFVSEPGLPQLVTDERKLMHIIRNLVGNAVKFTLQGEVLVYAASSGDRLELSVTDTGVGIAEPDLERIFDEFVQIEGDHQRQVQGTGLGLPLARKLAVLLGGTLEATSALGVGSRFTVTLPWRWEAAGSVTPTAHSTAIAAPESAGRETRHIDLVLIADDDAAARYVVRQQLEGLVGEIIEAGGGEEAFAVLETRHPTAVILDLSMPDVGGLEVLARMRATPELEQTAVIIHTSKELDTVERSEIELHGAVVVKKGEASATRLLTAILERRWPE